jgi:pimeloyl-ACP methyl ester carboxylesterase
MRARSSLATFTVSAVLALTATTTASAVTPTDATATHQAGAAAAPAAPGKDSKQRPVFFIKGYTPGDSCGKKWNAAAKLFKDSKWKGTLHRVGFYATDDPKCDVRIDPKKKGTAETSLKELGRGLAQQIYKKYSSKGQTVDLVGHSMGGLIARAALAGYQKGEKGWPKKLLVEDVVTLGTPHSGVHKPACFTRQCIEMNPGSGFRNWLGDKLPKADGGTDWTLVTSRGDWSVPPRFAAPPGTGAQHVVMYSDVFGLGHSDLRTQATGVFPLRYSNNGGAWGSQKRGAAPLGATMNALYWHSRW